MPCVYAVRNKLNTKLYIGSTVRKVGTRFSGHKTALSAGKHHSSRLQHDWNKYGESAFEFIVIEECKPEDCKVLEDYWIEYYDTSNIENGYNIEAKSHRRYEMTEEERAECENAVYIIDLEGLRRAIETRG